MSDLKKLTEEIVKFRDARDWKQFHTPKDLAVSITLEASEVLEHFQWKTDTEIKKYLKDHKEHIAEELADVLNYLLIMSHDLDIDIIDASYKKLEQNNKKYSVEKAKGNHTKYNKL